MFIYFLANSDFPIGDLSTVGDLNSERPKHARTMGRQQATLGLLRWGGGLLRRTALDELPQVINLLKGGISFVGPRALPPDMHEGYVNEDPDFPLRLQIRPGLTGMSQIKSPRHCGARERLNYDLLYIQKSGPYLDVKLIIISVWLTLAGKWGAGSRE